MFIYFLILDILLHESGHLMLSDFDLSKQSLPPGPPGIFNSPNTVIKRITFLYKSLFLLC